ncbi:MAG: potassium channel family protein [Candidatus Helarchaeales archaeon]
MDRNEIIRKIKDAFKNLIVQAILLTVIVVIVATFVFNFLEYGIFHHVPSDGSIITLDDALYWAIITVTTVGYGDVVPHSDFPTRVFTMIIAIYGSGVMMMTSGLIASYFVQKKFERQAEEALKGSENLREFRQITNIRALGLIGLDIGRAMVKLKQEKNQILIGFVRGDKIIINPPATETLKEKDKLLVF